MLRFYKADLSHDITIREVYEPPRPVLRPRTRHTSSAGMTGPNCDDTIYDNGIEPARSVRFVSSETQGFLTHAEVMAFIALYEAGGAFLVDTDLLVAIGAADVTYNALWEPGVTPEFTPVANGQLFFLDLPVRLKEATP